jgi:AraC-like DNA-binding protein
MMTALALLLAGYSLGCVLTLGLTHFSRSNYPEQDQARYMGLLLLFALGSLQAMHFFWLYPGEGWIGKGGVNSPWYHATLFLVAPAFFLFSRPLLSPLPPAESAAGQYHRLLPHFLPTLLALLLPGRIALPLAFLVGALYLLWLARVLYTLRAERENYPHELLLLGTVFVIALLVAALGLAQPLLPEPWFYALYTQAIGAAFLLVQIALALRPRLSGEVQTSVQNSYANAGYSQSTLTQLDCSALLARLEALMQQDRCFTDPDLSLGTLAARLGLNSHQLSELINTRLGKGFSRYLREQRIAAAKSMLCAEPSASVLSVGLNVGFTSQSNFYEAFRELEGMPPGQYRKLYCRKG